MSDLRPLVLMVCEDCRNGMGANCEAALCAFYGTIPPLLKPARSPEEMVEAAMNAAFPGLPAGMLTMDETRRRIVACLSAAIPGLLED